MPILNSSFEEIGATPGDALGWTLRAETSLVRVAAFTDIELGLLGVERFAWFDTSAPVSSVFAIFDMGITAGEAFEDFDEGYIDGPYLRLWSAGFEAAAPGVDPEDFDWMVGVWRGLWSELLPGEIDEASDTDFDVPGYIVTWAEVASSDAAEFDGPTNVEIFDSWTSF